MTATGSGRRQGGTRRPARHESVGKSPSRSSFLSILYEDPDIIAVDKPAGLPTISPEGSRGRSLYDLVTKHIQRRNPKGRAAVVHRIDRDSSGVVVFAKNASVKRSLMARWNELVRSRLYIALAEGEMGAESGVLDSWLRENKGGSVYETPAGVPGSLRAVTRWRLLKAGGGYSLLELELETGRKHQIRVQLAASGHPVAGDARYGARTDPAGRLALHAASIELAWPSDSDLVRAESPAPESFYHPLRGREKGLYYGTRKAGGRNPPEPRAARAAPEKDSADTGYRTSGGGYMKDKSKQAKEPKKKALKTLKEKRKEKKEKANNKAEE